MNCRRVEPLLSDHLDGLLPSRQASAIAAHVRDCPACRRLRDEITAVRAEYREWADQLCLPDSHPGQRAIQQWTTLQDRSHQSGRLLSDWRVSGPWGTPRLLLSPRGIAMSVTAVAFLLAVLGLL